MVFAYYDVPILTQMHGVLENYIFTLFYIASRIRLIHMARSYLGEVYFIVNAYIICNTVDIGVFDVGSLNLNYRDFLVMQSHIRRIIIAIRDILSLDDRVYFPVYHYYLAVIVYGSPAQLR